MPCGTNFFPHFFMCANWWSVLLLPLPDAIIGGKGIGLLVL